MEKLSVFPLPTDGSQHGFRRVVAVPSLSDDLSLSFSYTASLNVTTTATINVLIRYTRKPFTHFGLYPPYITSELRFRLLCCHSVYFVY